MRFAVASSLVPTHEVQARDASYLLSWGRAEVDHVSVSSYEVAAPAFTRGNITVRLSQTDPIASFAEASATFDVAFEILHPIR